jgi:phosphatidate cytidylyltransferase
MVRVLSGVALAIATLAAILFLPLTGLRLLAVAVALLATREFIGIARHMNVSPPQWMAYPLVAVACWYAAAPGGVTITEGVPIAVLTLLMVFVLFRNATLADAGAAVLAPIYIGLPIGTLAAVHALGGAEATLLLIFTIVISDTAQYYTGRLLGRHPLAPTVSPKKTVEGAIGGVVFGTAVMIAGGRRIFPQARVSILVAMGLAVVVLGITGDLFESKLKRSAEMKDSSALIPGHGGVLDRIDALLFASPTFYVFLHRVM